MTQHRRPLALAALLAALALAAGCGGGSSSSTVQIHGMVLGGPIAPACADFYQGGQVVAISPSGKTLARATLHKNVKASKGTAPGAYVYDFTLTVPGGLKHYILTGSGAGGTKTIVLSGRQVMRPVRLTC
jgi:hypothetical protein